MTGVVYEDLQFTKGNLVNAVRSRRNLIAEDSLVRMEDNQSSMTVKEDIGNTADNSRFAMQDNLLRCVHRIQTSCHHRQGQEGRLRKQLEKHSL